MTETETMTIDAVVELMAAKIGANASVLMGRTAEDIAREILSALSDDGLAVLPKQYADFIVQYHEMTRHFADDIEALHKSGVAFQPSQLETEE